MSLHLHTWGGQNIKNPKSRVLWLNTVASVCKLLMLTLKSFLEPLKVFWKTEGERQRLQIAVTLMFRHHDNTCLNLGPHFHLIFCMRRCSVTAWRAFCLNVLRSSCVNGEKKRTLNWLLLTSSLFPTLNWNKTKLYHQEGIQGKKSWRSVPPAYTRAHAVMREIVLLTTGFNWLPFIFTCFMSSTAKTETAHGRRTATCKWHAVKSMHIDRRPCSNTEHAFPPMCAQTHTHTHIQYANAAHRLRKCWHSVRRCWWWWWWWWGGDNGAVGLSVERWENTHQSY